MLAILQAHYLKYPQRFACCITAFPKAIPDVVSNPPKLEDVSEPGYYLWGTENGIEAVLNRLKERRLK